MVKEKRSNQKVEKGSQVKSKLGSLKNQIVDNIYQYYDSKQPIDDAGPAQENYFNMSSADEKGGEKMENMFGNGELGKEGEEPKREEDEREEIGEREDQENSSGTQNIRSKREMSVQEKHEQKISDITFPFENQEEFIEFGDQLESPNSNKPVDTDKLENEEDNFDFNLTGNLAHEIQPLMMVKPGEEYGQIKGKFGRCSHF